MVQSVTLPFGVLNNIPGVAGVEDVAFDIPQVEDIRQEINQAVPSLDEIRAVVQEEVAQLDIPEPDFGQVEIEGSLFSIEQDFVDILAQALSQADLLDVPQFPTLEEIEALLEEAVPEVPEPDIPTAEEVADAVENRLAIPEPPEPPDVSDIPTAAADAVVSRLEELPGATLLTDPDQFVDDQLARLESRLVSEEASQALQDTLEEFQ